MNYPVISLIESKEANIHTLNIALPTIFDTSEEILGINLICPLSMYEQGGEVCKDFGVIETTNGFVGLYLTDEQTHTLQSIFGSSVCADPTKVADYPKAPPTTDNPTLLAYKITGFAE